MALENKLGITNSAELAREEERISKTRAVELFETKFLSYLTPGMIGQSISTAFFIPEMWVCGIFTFSRNLS